jgi:two-component system, OmpR family, sensor kinase
MNTRSIGFQLTAWYAGVIAVVFLLLGGFMYLGMKHHLEKSLRETQAKRAGVIAETLVARVAQLGEEHVIQEIRESYAPELNSRFIRVTRPDSTVLYVCGVPADLSFDPAKVPVPATAPARAYARVESPPDSESLLIVTGPVPTATGTFRIEVGASLGPLQAVLREWLVTFTLAFPLLLAVAAGGGWFLARRALEPVRKIIHGTEQISSHNLGERLPVPRTGDELERLSTALNQMIARLDEALSHNRRFMADASHELRTPLTILRGELETMLQQTDGAPELQDRLGSVLEEVERLAKIVENLFALSRLDAGEAQAESVQFDLGQLAATTAEQMSLLRRGQAGDAQLPRAPGRERRGRPRPAQAGGREPPRQRGQIHAARRLGHVVRRRRAEPRQSRAGGRGHGHGHSYRRAAARLRALLPRGQGPLARTRRRGYRAVHREGDLLRARRPGGGG